MGSPIDQYRGEVRICRFCKNADPTAPPELKTYCKFCTARGYTADCKRCDGTGLVGGGNVWGNSKSGDYKSTCDVCGGNKVIPATEAAFQLQEQAKLVSAPQPPAAAFKALNEFKGDVVKSPAVVGNEKGQPSQS